MKIYQFQISYFLHAFTKGVFPKNISIHYLDLLINSISHSHFSPSKQYKSHSIISLNPKRNVLAEVRVLRAKKYNLEANYA